VSVCDLGALHELVNLSVKLWSHWFTEAPLSGWNKLWPSCCVASYTVPRNLPSSSVGIVSQSICWSIM